MRTHRLSWLVIETDRPPLRTHSMTVVVGAEWSEPDTETQIALLLTHGLIILGNL
jgi:hypothetical protein